MLFLFRILFSVSITGFIGCNSGVRDLDFINKQFQATYNIDSTRTIDSTLLTAFSQAKAVYNFSEGGRGKSHIQMGPISTDIPFTWKIKNDSLSIDQSMYFVRKQDRWLVLINDSVKLVLSQQP